MTTLSTGPLPANPPARRRKAWLPLQQCALLGVIVLEVFVFSLLGTNFLSADNFMQVLRLNVELGLLALALTAVIVTGGIDLSVGSMMGLAAVCFGKLMRDGGLPPAAAAAAALAVGAAGGLLNALLIARLRVPALIVTLGTFSLFRGMAEGISAGSENYTSFPDSFLFLGQGFVGPLPVQAIIFIVAIAVFGFLLHRSTLGRTWVAVGYATEGARFAGLPVAWRTGLTYVLSGLCAAAAALIFAARVGQAKADAGTGYELSAITAVVLGGTSIFGGRGSIVGTLLGLLALSLVENGLRLADLPPELSGIFKGALLLGAISLGLLAGRGRAAPRVTPAVAAGDLDMKNTQFTVLCVVILVAALIVVVGNFALVGQIKRDASGRSVATTAGGPTDATGAKPAKKLTVAMMPKSKGNAYFIACRQGAEEAAKELDLDLLWDGPTDPDPAKQNEIVDTWITRGVDVIVVSVENRDALSTALRKARKAGIKVVTFDADAQPDARDWFVNQATPQGIGFSLMDNAARVMNNTGEFAIITSSLTAPNQNEWLKHIKSRLADKYPDIKLAALRPSDDLQAKAFEETRTILNAYPKVKLFMAISSPAVPGAAEGVKQAGRTGDVKVIGLGLPNENKPYVHEGITQAVVLWNTNDLGYLAVRVADLLALGQLKPGDKTVGGGRLGKIEIEGDNVLLGKPFTFDKSNIDQFDF